MIIRIYWLNNVENNFKCFKLKTATIGLLSSHITTCQEIFDLNHEY